MIPLSVFLSRLKKKQSTFKYGIQHQNQFNYDTVIGIHTCKSVSTYIIVCGKYHTKDDLLIMK